MLLSSATSVGAWVAVSPHRQQSACRPSPPGPRCQVQPCSTTLCPLSCFLTQSCVTQVGLDQQTVTLVCTNRRKQFLLDTADVALTE